MRVRVIKEFTDITGIHHMGETVDVSPAIVKFLTNCGLVMQDKSLDGAKETKVRDDCKANTR